MDSFGRLLQHYPCPEQFLHEAGFKLIAGVDEVGRGPLAGPVVAAAVILPHHWHHPEIKDSKQLSASQRERLFHDITRHAVTWGWSLCDAGDIDRSNILAATLCAMRKAITQLDPSPDYVIVDGPHAIPTSVQQTPIVRGDQKSPLIAAASIIAKVVRDAIMQKYHVLFPQYNFARNKGYGTREHRDALARYGYCPIHRTTFRNVAAR
ncbi:MAG: ribonuclease HII [Desulfobacterota bacterium]|nr:ribonuclease HII [Thermodesulfobacteriota bacterium]